MALLVVAVSGVTPPPVEQEAEEEGEDESGIEVGSMNIEDAVPLERCSGIFPESPVAGKGANSGNQS